MLFWVIQLIGIICFVQLKHTNKKPLDKNIYQMKSFKDLKVKQYKNRDKQYTVNNKVETHA